MSLEECRAEAIAAYLAFDEGILSTMGFSDTSEITADDSKKLLKEQRNISETQEPNHEQSSTTCTSHLASSESPHLIATNPKPRYYFASRPHEYMKSSTDSIPVLEMDFRS